MINNVVIVGGGIVGLSVALKLKELNNTYKITILEKESRIASHQTGHNSGVIHSGLYYKPNSLKAHNCVRGRKILLKFCEEEQIHHEICGKIVVASNDAQCKMLDELESRGKANGLKGIKRLNESQIQDHEPYAVGKAGLFVPETGIVDYKQVSEKMAEKLLHFGADIHTSNKVVAFKKEANNLIKVITSKETFITRLVINCAGLHSDAIAKLSKTTLKSRIIPFRGEYYALKKEKSHLVKNLIYPVPDPKFPFLGVHFTRRVDGMIEAGPNAVLAFAREGYSKSQINLAELFPTIFYKGFINVAKKYWRQGMKEMKRSFSKQDFVNSLQELVPAIQKGDVIKAGAGVRAQACDPNGQLIDDFMIEEQKQFIHVINAPSPAATASLMIGEHIAQLAKEQMK